MKVSGVDDYVSLREINNEDVAKSLSDYIEKGKPPYNLLLSILHNDLYGEVRRAREYQNIDMLLAVLDWVDKESPIDCWGSRRNVEKWVYDKGWYG